MKVYVDTSVAIRVLFGEPKPLASWGQWTDAYASRLWHTEALRVLERVRMTGRHTQTELIHVRQAIDLVHEHFNIHPVTEAVLSRAGEAFPAPIGTLDALHLSTALHIRDERGLDAFLTHDAQLATAAAAMGFKVEGV